MKHKLFFTAAIVTASSFIIPSKKTVEKIQAKPFGYMFSIMDANGKGEKLQIDTAYHKPRLAIPTHTLDGAKSSRRFPITTANFQTYADNSTRGLNPSYYIFLYKLTEGTDRRTFTDNLSTNAPSTNPALIPISITQKDNNSYTISVQGVLFKGEYAFIDKSTIKEGQITVWTFGID